MGRGERGSGEWRVGSGEWGVGKGGEGRGEREGRGKGEGDQVVTMEGNWGVVRMIKAGRG